MVNAYFQLHERSEKQKAFEKQGKLDLDAPIFKALDPWFQSQGMPTLKEQWGGDATVEQVTTRHLLQMLQQVAELLLATAHPEGAGVIQSLFDSAARLAAQDAAQVARPQLRQRQV